MEIKLHKTQSNDKEILEMILQYLYENRYTESAKLLESRANIVYDQNEIQQLKTLLKEYKFDEAINFLERANFEFNQRSEVLKIIKTRKFFEIIKTGNNINGLEYLRNEIRNIITDKHLLNRFSVLLFQKENIERTFKQYFPEIYNDDLLIKKVQSLLCLSLDSNGNRILPNSRLESLLNSYSMDMDSDSSSQLKLTKQYIIEKHEDEVWHLSLSNSGKYLATGSRNGMICIFLLSYNPGSITITCKNSFLSHKKHITALDWSANEKYLLSSSADKLIKLWDPFTGKCIKNFFIHNDIVTTIKWLGDDTFISGSIDKKLIVSTIHNRTIMSETFFRIRKILVIRNNYAIIIPASMNDIIIYDYKNYKEIHRITELDPIISANISHCGNYLITNCSKVNAYINLYNLNDYELINKYYGHTQEQYIIECLFSRNDKYIIAGSEDYNVYIWNKGNSIPAYVIPGHTGAINNIVLTDYPMMITVSDDYTIRIWTNDDIELIYKDNTTQRKISELYRESIMNVNGYNNEIDSESEEVRDNVEMEVDSDSD